MELSPGKALAVLGAMALATTCNVALPSRPDNVEANNAETVVAGAFGCVQAIRQRVVKVGMPIPNPATSRERLENYQAMDRWLKKCRDHHTKTGGFPQP